MLPPLEGGQLVRHKLQVHFDPHQCQLTTAEIDKMSADLDSLARQVGNFPMAELRVLIERNARTTEFSAKLTLILPGETLVTSDHDRTLHPAFERSLASLEDALRAYKDRLNQMDERRKHQNGTHQELTPATAVDPYGLDDAVAAGDYPAFRVAIAPYEDPLRLRVGRWVERYPAVQARMGRGLETIDLVEDVFLAAFEKHASRPPGVRYGEWLEGMIDPVVRAFEHHPDRELENVNMARSACAAVPKSGP
jgi:ribosome-associated translation inhibitor RaiA